MSLNLLLNSENFMATGIYLKVYQKRGRTAASFINFTHSRGKRPKGLLIELPLAAKGTRKYFHGQQTRKRDQN